MKTGICKLCGEEAPLLKQSHLIPSFMYRGIVFDPDKDTMMRVQSSPKKYPKQKGLHFKEVQTGFFDKDMLCATCDNDRLGAKVEHVMDKQFFPKVQDMAHSPQKLKRGANVYWFIEVETTPQRLVQKFFLSILWRASLARIHGFHHLNLGEKREDAIRNFLLDKSSDALHDWAVMLHVKDSSSEDRAYGVTIRPIPSDKGYLLMVGPYFVLYLNKMHKPNLPQELCLSLEGPTPVIVISDQEWLSYKTEMLQRFVQISQQNATSEEILTYLQKYDQR